MITKWLHFEELGGNQWILPIYAAANAAEERKKYQPLSTTITSLGTHVATRLNVLPCIIDRLNQNCQSVYEKIKGHGVEYVFSDTQEGYVFSLDHNLKYCLIADINSFFFELNTCSELITDFAKTLYHHVGRPVNKEDILKDIRNADKQTEIDKKWFALLDKNRNFFAHNGTPYIAVDISTPNSPELLIMKDNIDTFNDPTMFLTISDLNSISRGFTKTNSLLQELLIGLFE